MPRPRKRRRISKDEGVGEPTEDQTALMDEIAEYKHCFEAEQVKLHSLKEENDRLKKASAIVRSHIQETVEKSIKLQGEAKDAIHDMLCGRPEMNLTKYRRQVLQLVAPYAFDDDGKCKLKCYSEQTGISYGTLFPMNFNKPKNRRCDHTKKSYHADDLYMLKNLRSDLKKTLFERVPLCVLTEFYYSVLKGRDKTVLTPWSMVLHVVNMFFSGYMLYGNNDKIPTGKVYSYHWNLKDEASCIYEKDALGINRMLWPSVEEDEATSKSLIEQDYGQTLCDGDQIFNAKELILCGDILYEIFSYLHDGKNELNLRLVSKAFNYNYLRTVESVSVKQETYLMIPWIVKQNVKTVSVECNVPWTAEALTACLQQFHPVRLNLTLRRKKKSQRYIELFKRFKPVPFMMALVDCLESIEPMRTVRIFNFGNTGNEWRTSDEISLLEFIATSSREPKNEEQGSRLPPEYHRVRIYSALARAFPNLVTTLNESFLINIPYSQ